MQLFMLINLILLIFSLYSSASAGIYDTNGATNAPKILIKEGVIDRDDTLGSHRTYSYAAILKDATPSVVSVFTSKYLRNRPLSKSPKGAPETFDNFGFPKPNRHGNSKENEGLIPFGAGSGVLITNDGYVVTNHHVVHDQEGNAVDKIMVRFNDGHEFIAELIGTDKKTDIAILKIRATQSLESIIVGDSNQNHVGDVVFAIGNPLHVGITVTQGIISATGRDSLGILGQDAYEDFIQTDASINSGNSGGPLIDACGQLIGINTAILSSSGGGNIGIGFAIPVNLVLEVMQDIIELGEVRRGSLGVFPVKITAGLAESFGLISTKGVLVNQVQEGSPAEKSGIKHGDAIVRIGPKAITKPQELRLEISQLRPGSSVLIELIRDGETHKVPVVLGDVEDFYTAAGAFEILDGVMVKKLSGDMRASLSVPESISGFVVSAVKAQSPYSQLIYPNTVIMEINGEKIAEIEQLKSLLIAGFTNRLYVWDAGNISYIVVKL